MKNYYHSTEETAWPLKEVVSKIEVPNVYDTRGAAYRLDLECGHHVIATGPVYLVQVASGSSSIGVACRVFHADYVEEDLG